MDTVTNFEMIAVAAAVILWFFVAAPFLVTMLFGYQPLTYLEWVRSGAEFTTTIVWIAALFCIGIYFMGDFTPDFLKDLVTRWR